MNAAHAAIKAIVEDAYRVPARQKGDQTSDWPEPLNLFDELTAPPYRPETMPVELSAYAAAYSEATGIDPSITLSSAIATAAGALSDDFSIVADSRSSWFQQGRLWFIHIGRPGSGKTPGEKAMTKPLWSLQTELLKAYHDHLAQIGDDDDQPRRPRLIIGDTTIEALSEVLRENSRGILINADEFESWLGAMDMYRRGGGASRDRGEWLRLFDGGPHTIERVQRGSVFVPNWGVSILTASTPASMAKLMRQLPEDGLLQRFIPIIARRHIVTDADTRPLEPLREAYGQTIRRLWCASPRAHSGAVPLSHAAQEYFREWRKGNHILQDAMGSLSSALQSHIAKYPTLLLRLALVFHCSKVVNHEHEGARDPAAWPVHVDTLIEAANFLRTASRHAMALYAGSGSGADAFDLARTIAKTILAKTWQRLERRHLVQYVRAFREADERGQDTALRLLADAGWIQPEDTGYDKGRWTRLVVNPAAAKLFEGEAQAERARRTVMREAIEDSATSRRTDATPE